MAGAAMALGVVKVGSELIGKLSQEAAGVLKKYYETESAKDLASFVAWSDLARVSAGSIAEIVVTALKSDTELISSSNNTIKDIIQLLEKCFTSADNPSNRDKVFSLIMKLSDAVIDTQKQANTRKNVVTGAAITAGTSVVGVGIGIAIKKAFTKTPDVLFKLGKFIISKK